MELLISQLIEYAVRKKWMEDSDRIWASNRILEALRMDGFDGLVDIEGELPQIQDIETAVNDINPVTFIRREQTGGNGRTAGGSGQLQKGIAAGWIQSLYDHIVSAGRDVPGRPAYRGSAVHCGNSAVQRNGCVRQGGQRHNQDQQHDGNDKNFFQFQCSPFSNRRDVLKIHMSTDDCFLHV